MEYNFKEIEENWQKFWAENKTFAAKDDSTKEKYYVLDMFPYPSGAGLHVGHPLGYIASDIIARFKRHKGFNVLHPMGYDSFGLPAEQYAIQTGQHPKITTENNIAVYRRQLDKIGFSFDWDREVRTSNPDYYKWTQWIFIQIFNSWYNKNTNKAEPISKLSSEFEAHGNASIHAHCDDNVKSFTAQQWQAFSEKEKSDVLMAYRMAYLGEAYVNWCPQLGTVLANDEIKDGVSERGGYPVERKLMKQWSMRITAYAQRLLTGLDTLDWTDSLKEAQRNWIGKSEGTSLKFKVVNSSFDIEVFTTRPDTIFGVSFVTLAPEHELVNSLTTPENKVSVEAYVTQAKNRSERERQADINKITGVPTGSFVEHPFTGKHIPIWIGDYVLAGYGTGAVMAVSAHDSRDYSFAKHFGLPILEVVAGGDLEKESYDAKEGKLINSDFLNGLDVKAAMKKAIAEIETKNLGKGKVNFRLRDAVFGRQRYWGEPIPIYYKNDIPYALSESELPLVLPEVDKYLPTEDGEPPLARATNWRYRPLSNSPQGGENTKPHNWETAGDSSYNFTKEKAQELRKNQTEAEQILWEAIRKKSLDVKFRRQHIIGSNIVDFVSLETKLVIEVDGKIHLDKKEYDAERTKELESVGFSVIRFTNEEITNDIENVISKIKLKLEELPKVLPTGEDLGGASYPFEHSTMPGWAGSSWYFLRYMNPHNGLEFASKKLADYWKQVDLYIGGSEHATGHLLYVRFWTKFLNDLGHIAIDEPAKKLINQGMIQGLSSKAYRLALGILTHYAIDSEESKKEHIPSNEIPAVFVSKELYDGFCGDGENPNKEFITKKINEVVLEIGNKLKIMHPEKTGRVNFQNTIFQINVDINLVSKNNTLDIEAFKNWRPDYNNSIFITGENGDYLCGQEVEKMSKSKYNVVTPDDIAEKFGSDTLRLYEMFLGPLEQSKPWNTNGITGVHGFLKKLWRLFYQNEAFTITTEEPTKAELKTLHKTIKKITEDIERFSFNTSVSNFMICVNELTDLKCNKKEILEPLLICLSPYAPHITEELWKQLGHTESIAFAPFPLVNEVFLVDDSINYPVSVNGKLKFTLELPATLTKEEVEEEVMKNEQTIKLLAGQQPKKVIVVHKKIVNMVV
jgi:leucyl-tRNA synthetase